MPFRRRMFPPEQSLEQLLLRIVPGLESRWQGSSDADIARLEAIAGQPLPDLYRWFLARMGQSMGPMAYPTIDFSAAGVLAAYGSGRIAQSPRYLLIGYEHDEVSPLHYFYDLETRARGDALVVRMLTPADETHEQFETLREMLAWGELYTNRVAAAPQQCRGSVRHAGGALQERLEPVLHRLGFTSPIETGPVCGLYERADATLLCTGTPRDIPSVQTFSLAGHDAPSLAQILNALPEGDGLELDISAWSPPLPG